MYPVRLHYSPQGARIKSEYSFSKALFPRVIPDSLNKWSSSTRFLGFPKPYTITADLQPGAPKRLSVQVVSDVHLNNHEHASSEDGIVTPTTIKPAYDNPRRRHFRRWLDTLYDHGKHNPQQLVLILNGDILDVNGSWFDANHPCQLQNKNTSAPSQTLHRVVQSIIDNNASVFDRLQSILAQPFARIVYVIGNHDHLLKTDPTIQQRIRDRLMPGLSPEEQARKFIFSQAVDIPDVGLYATHGHHLDPFNRIEKSRQACWGDWVTVQLVNGSIRHTVATLKAAALPEPVIEKITKKLHHLEYIRPSTAVPIYIKQLAKQYESLYATSNPEMGKTISKALMSFSDALGDACIDSIAILRKSKHSWAGKLVRSVLQNPRIQRIFARIVSLAEAWSTDSNRAQIREVRQWAREKGYKMVTYGHTHSPEYRLVEGVRYINTGTWKHAIHAFLDKGTWIFPEKIVPRSILKCSVNLEKPLEKRKIHFQVETMEKGKIRSANINQDNPN